MADFAGGGMGGGQGDIMHQIESWIMETPPCTRYWTAATLVTAILVHSKIVSPFQLFYSYRTVFVKRQFWRLVTTYCYFGSFNLELLFHIYFTTRYARLLEAGSPSTGHFFWTLCLLSVTILVLSHLFSLLFLGPPLSSTLVYIWSRRNPDVTLSFLGLFTFKAPYLPYVMALLNIIMHSQVPRDEILGIVVGHCWWFGSDVVPGLYGTRFLDPPAWWPGQPPRTQVVDGVVVVGGQGRQQNQEEDRGQEGARAAEPPPG